jgi:omega-amidase
MLPECFNSPYGIQHFPNYAEPETASETLDFLRPLIRELQMYVIAGSIPEEEGGKFYNTCYCLDESGEITAKHRKVHLFDMEIPGKFRFFESEVLTPGDKPTLFETRFGTIGIGICYDIRFPEYAQCIAKNAVMIAYPGCFPVISGERH